MKEMATHSRNLALRIPWTEEPGGYSPWGHKELDTTERLILVLYKRKDREKLDMDTFSTQTQRTDTQKKAMWG